MFHRPGGYKVSSMHGAAGTSHKTNSQRLIFGAFGWPEKALRIEPCPEADCVGREILPTDLYCASHDRFLPLVRNWANGERITAILAVAAVIYGGFALSAELNSWLPIFLLYSMIGMGVVGLPLRLFPTTVRVAILIWVLACACSLSYRLAGSHTHAVIATTALIVAACAMGLRAGLMSVDGSLNARVFTNEGHRSRAVLGFVTAAFVTTVAAGAIALGLVIIPRRLLLNEPGLLLVAIITGLGVFALGLITAIVAGMIDGAPRISFVTHRFGLWRGPAPRSWSAHRTAIRRRRIHNIMDRLGEVSRHALIRLADALRISSVAATRATANLLLAAVRIIVNSLIYCVNFVVRMVTLAARVILSGIVSTWWFFSRAMRLALGDLGYGFGRSWPAGCRSHRSGWSFLRRSRRDTPLSCRRLIVGSAILVGVGDSGYYRSNHRLDHTGKPAYWHELGIGMPFSNNYGTLCADSRRNRRMDSWPAWNPGARANSRRLGNDRVECDPCRDVHMVSVH